MHHRQVRTIFTRQDMSRYPVGAFHDEVQSVDSELKGQPLAECVLNKLYCPFIWKKCRELENAPSVVMDFLSYLKPTFFDSTEDSPLSNSTKDTSKV